VYKLLLYQALSSWSLSQLALAFPAQGLALGNTPPFAFGNKEALFPGISQDAGSHHLLAKATQ
jgi:hypothetical protein